jgi:hypothetical protein
MEIDMFKVYYSNLSAGHSFLIALDTEDEALQFAAKLGALYLEVDEAHPGCYDGIDKHGRVICIEPFNLKLSA